MLVSTSFADLVDSINIRPGYRSDHSMVEVTFLISNFKRGRGTWKLNNSLLKDPEYISLVNNCIREEYHKYALPIYEPEYLEKAPFQNIQLTLADDMFLETLLLRIWGESIKYGAYKKRSNINFEKSLASEIEKLESGNSDTDFELLELKRQELIEYRQKAMQGHLIRSRSQWVAEGEKPSKYFCALEQGNYLDKTIKYLQKKDQSYTRDQKEILNEVKNFYANLFKENENTAKVNLQKLLTAHNIKKLNEDQAMSMNGYLSIEELGLALKNTKNNKTPGLDGFSFEFFKIFWKNMKFCVANAVNHSFDKGTLPLSLRQCVITCLLKNGKVRSDIKNWRPLSMLSVIYKLASAAIANRIKPHLDHIIDSTQCGFVPGRYIGECTRLIFDIMKFTEDRRLPGMLVLIDFEKAFDSISWSFIYETMEFLGFSKNLVDWVKLFNRDIKATIIQYGVLSEFIDIQWGCRQGDPIAPYLFILVAQILTILITNNKKIKGIKIGTMELKLTQFADDTTLILDGSSESLHAAFNTLEIFGTISGLKVNTDKTQIAWIGKKKNSKDKRSINNLNINPISKFKLLGISICVNLQECVKINFSQKMVEIKELIKRWNKRYLTPLGKITIVKTFLVAKLIHLFTCLPNPDEAYIKEINDLFFNFVWSSKPDKINRHTIMLDKKLGGLKMINIKDFIISLKVSWIRRLFIASEKSLWINLFEKNFNVSVSKAINFGSGFAQVLKKKPGTNFGLTFLMLGNSL